MSGLIPMVATLSCSQTNRQTRANILTCGGLQYKTVSPELLFLCVDLQRSLKVIGNVKLSVGNTIVWSGIIYTRSSVCHERLLIVLGPIWVYEQRDQLVMLQWCGFWDVLIPDTVLRDGQK